MNVNLKYAFFTVALGLLSCLSYGQKEPLYTQYMFNIGSFNPAYAASLEDADYTLAYRAQWVGLDGAPTTFRLGYNKPFDNGKNGLGINISRDEIGPASQTFFDIAYSFQIQLGGSTFLSMGLDGGASILNLDFSQGNFRDPNEPLLNQSTANNFYPTVGAGLFLYDTDWYVGASVPNFLAANFYSEEIRSLTPEQLQFDVIAGYIYTSPSEMFKLKPAILMSYTNGIPVNMNLSATAMFSDMVILGANYRLQNSLSAIAGVQVAPSFYIGYAYDYNTNNLGEYNSGSHEIVIKYYTGRKSRSSRARRNGKNGKENVIDSPRFF